MNLDEQVSGLLPKKIKVEPDDKENVKRVCEGFNHAINLTHKTLKRLVREGKITLL
jgi:hypothetical protein